MAEGHQREHPQPSRLKASGAPSGLPVVRALVTKDLFHLVWKTVFYFIETLSRILMTKYLPGWEPQSPVGL